MVEQRFDEPVATLLQPTRVPVFSPSSRPAGASRIERAAGSGGWRSAPCSTACFESDTQLQWGRPVVRALRWLRAECHTAFSDSPHGCRVGYSGLRARRPLRFQWPGRRPTVRAKGRTHRTAMHRMSASLTSSPDDADAGRW